jgi:hypothetical protein
MAEQAISQILFTQATTGTEKARFELLMRKWRRELLSDKALGMSIAERKVFVNEWLTEFEDIFRNQSTKINILSGYNGFVSASAINGIASDIDDYLDNYRQIVSGLSGKDLTQARGLRNSLALRLKKEGVENIYKSFDAFSKESRALGLTQKERVDGFLNTLGKKYSTIQTKSVRTGAVRFWKPDTYARMYSNTRDSEMRDEIFQEQLIDIGSDVVQVSSHGTDTPICQQYEGRVFSLMGNTPNLPVLQQRPGFHTNCKQVLTSRPRLTAREARKINFKQSKRLASQKKDWTKSDKKMIRNQEAYNLKNKPPKAGLTSV